MAAFDSRKLRRFARRAEHRSSPASIQVRRRGSHLLVAFRDAIAPETLPLVRLLLSSAVTASRIPIVATSAAKRRARAHRLRALFTSEPSRWSPRHPYLAQRRIGSTHVLLVNGVAAAL